MSDRRSADGWVSASDLAEYAYCPRAWYYRGHPPPHGPTRSSQRSARAGDRYHRSTLRDEEFREGHLGAYVVAILLGLALLLGGLWWIFR